MSDFEEKSIAEWFANNSSSSEDNESEMYLNACICESPAPYVYDSTYRAFNTYFIIGFLPVVGTFGVITNVVSFLVFAFGPSDLKSSHYYLAALAASDIAVDWCGMSVIAADSGRRFSDFLNNIHLTVSTYIMPLCTIAQTCSVYFTVFTTVDCFVSLRNPASGFCKPTAIKRTLFMIVASAVLYNAVTFWELKVVTCVDYKKEREIKHEICPTELRMNPLYMEVYKVYCYAIFIVALPFLLLLLLTVFIVVLLVRKNRGRPAGESESGDEQDSPLMLVLVVLLFLVCNSIGFAVNMIEIFAPADDSDSDSQIGLLFVIDVSNFLVVFNSSANFLVYVTFSKFFRSTLQSKLTSMWQKIMDRKKPISKPCSDFRNVLPLSEMLVLPGIRVEDTSLTIDDETDRLLTTVSDENPTNSYGCFQKFDFENVYILADSPTSVESESN